MLDDLDDSFWSRVGRLARPPRPDVVANPPSLRGGVLDADVCIVTNCTFPGGNAATTLTELRTLEAAGLRVVLVNCSIKKSRWKRTWISNRYLPVADRLVQAHRVRRITCRTAIVRGPRMIMTRNFERLVPRIVPEHALFVVNNSAWTEDGRPIFSWPRLHERVAALDWPSKELCPIGPLIRAESDRAIEDAGTPSVLSKRDWPPVIDETSFRFDPRPRLTPPVVIGRHARDHPAKWPSDLAEVLAAYPPDDPGIRVRIMGGAETIRKSFGAIPEGWEVLPFGIDGVDEYLSSLDVFVNFPSPARYEAFGRTIVEAILSGLPVILPPRFEATFGELAFYCAPGDVRRLVHRLAADDEGRLAHLRACRNLATSLYCSPSLLRRLHEGSDVDRPRLERERAAWRSAILGECEPHQQAGTHERTS